MRTIPRLLLLALGGLLLGAPALARAEEAAGSRVSLNVTPVLVHDEAAPGETIQRVYTLRNDSELYLPVHAGINDVASKNTSGELQFITDPGVPRAAPWVTLADPDLIIDPHTSRTVRATITIPEHAEPGRRTLTILFSVAPQNTGSDDTNVTVLSRIATIFFLNVKGDVHPAARITRVIGPRFTVGVPTQLGLRVENTGNVFIEPYGDIVVRSLFGREIERIATFDQGSLAALPHSTREMRFAWNPPHGFGIYRISAVMNLAPGVVETREFWMVSLYLPLLLILLAALWLYRKKLLRLKLPKLPPRRKIRGY